MICEEIYLNSTESGAFSKFRKQSVADLILLNFKSIFYPPKGGLKMAENGAIFDPPRGGPVKSRKKGPFSSDFTPGWFLPKNRKITKSRKIWYPPSRGDFPRDSSKKKSSIFDRFSFSSWVATQHFV